MEQLNISVGYAAIDLLHQELSQLTVRLMQAGDSEFPLLYQQLIEHTDAHFQHEEQLMQRCGFIHAAEHIAEHQQMLAEMKQFGRRPRALARAYVRERLAERFHLHITRMDSLLAAHLTVA